MTSTVSGFDWTDAVETNADGSIEHCICFVVEVGAQVGVWGCPIHAKQVYIEFLDEIATHGGLAGDIAKARLSDMAKVREPEA